MSSNLGGFELAAVTAIDRSRGVFRGVQLAVGTSCKRIHKLQQR
uniref:Uncharacterized protein n=1 Tax=Arundo donax TaxID=35708 RepID=A0A0A9D8J2_ARUDO